MVAVLLSTLFITSGLTAAATIVANLRRYAPAMKVLRTDLVESSEWREVRVSFRIVEVRQTAAVLRPDFKANRLPEQQPALPAAA